MTNATIAVGGGLRRGLMPECGGAMDEAIASMLLASDGSLLINAKAVAVASGVRNRMAACVTALERAVKKYAGTITPGTETEFSRFEVTLVKPKA